MGSRKGKPSLPPVMVTLGEGQPTPAQAAAWRKLWQRLLENETPGQAPQPARGEEGNGSATSG